jgi:hypothetical protein
MLLTTLLVFLTYSGIAQGIYDEKRKATINLIDAKGMKQGTWVFYAQDGSEKMTCTYKNDRIDGVRVFIIDSVTTLHRAPLVNKVESFELHRGDVVEKGVFDFNKKTIVFANGRTAETIDSNVKFLMGVPPLYGFGERNAIDAIETRVDSLRRIAKSNKAVIDLSIDKNGIVLSTSVKLTKPHKKLEVALQGIYSSMGRWQPAFDTWETKPYKKKIIITFDKP